MMSSPFHQPTQQPQYSVAAPFQNFTPPGLDQNITAAGGGSFSTSPTQNDHQATTAATTAFNMPLPMAVAQANQIAQDVKPPPTTAETAVSPSQPSNTNNQ